MEVLSRKSTFRIFSLFISLLLSSAYVFSQDGTGEESIPAVEEELPLVTERITPVFPDVEEGLIYVEGESAVSTNFASTPVYNYGASGYKSLQLIQQNAPYGGQAYFAEYAFYVDEEGSYDFWYGGTPPGPKDTLFPSYASPFRYVLDGEDPVSVYREDLAVNEAYTPSYYWMSVQTIHLSEGVHRIRIEVPEKRRYDGQYYFFLDAFFFLRQDRMEEELTLVPPVFPKNRADRSFDNPFQSISFYEKIIQEDPANKDAYIVLSMIYSLLGDYINSIKNLNKAASLDPKDPYPLLLTAKNRIWNQEVTEGLTMYRQLLTLAPDNVSYWTEAGKVAAWTGNYRDSIDFFTRGLEKFPDNLSLKVNLGLTYLWMSRTEDAETVFKEAQESTEGLHDKAMELGSLHKISGYPQYALNIYNQDLLESPEYLETYLNLEESYRLLGDTEKAEEIIQYVYDSFEESLALSEYMNVYEEKKSMKDGILQAYMKALEEQPDNIPLRQLLSQTFFWNGMKEEAVDHSLRILINKLYTSMREFDSKAADLLSLLDRFFRYEELFLQTEDAYQRESRELTAAQNSYEKALASAAKKPEDTSLAAKADLATQEYVEAYELYKLWSSRMEELDRNKAGLLQEWTALLDAEKENESVFRQLLGESEWTWDREFNLNELKQVQRSEPFLSGYVLSRLALFEGKVTEAGKIIDSDLFAEDPPSRYGLYQSHLWNLNRADQKEMWAEEADILTLYRQHLFDMEASEWKEGEARFIIPLPEETEALRVEMTERSQNFKADKEENSRLIADMRQSLDQMLVRQIYYYEQDTYLLRYSLGDYYLEMDENLKATRQFERVLAMDPWNISANYKLGIVSQRYGDWSRAMDQYKKVYYQNPGYENASYYYNQLARENADTVSVSAQTITDPTRIKYVANAAYQSNLNSWLGWGLSYDLTMDRKYRVYETGEIPNQYKLHSLDINAPLTYNRWNLVITPVAGLYLWSDLYGVDETRDFGDSLVTPADTAEAMNVKPLLGLDLDWGKDFLETGLSYRYQLEEESLFSDRNLTRSHFMSAHGDTYFPLENSYDWGPVLTRTYGQFEILDTVSGESNQNFKGQILQNASITYVAFREPMIRLTANGTFNFENGSVSDTTMTDYYLPQGVLEAKGGLRGTINFHNEEYTEALEISLFGAAGGYWTDIIQRDDPTQSMKMEGLFSLSYVKQTMTLYFLLSGNGTFNTEDSALNFWEFAATVGARISVPSLLTN
jgi:tetratricopeptide (TPR) repeat protein